MPYNDNADSASSLNGSSTARNAVAVVPHDSNDIGQYPRALYVGVAGDVSLQPVRTQGADAAVVFKNVPAGMILPVGCRRVNATGTTASSIVGLL